MKKNLFLAVFAAIALCMGFTSCGDDKEVIPSKEETKSVTAKFVMKNTCNEAYNSLADVVSTIEITENGKTSVKLADCLLKDEIKYDELECPCKISIKYKPELKEDVKYDDDAEYNLFYGVEIDVSSSNGTYPANVSTKEKYPVMGWALKEFFNVIGIESSVTITVDKDGKITQ